jgi:hypothetical protein
MKPSTNHAFVNQLLVYTLVMICLSGSAGLGTVWMRHQISVTANATKRTELALADVERRISEATARLASEQSPDMLDRKNEAMALGLVPARDIQIVRIEESAEERLAAKRNIDLFAEEASTGTASVRFSLNDFVSR